MCFGNSLEQSLVGAIPLCTELKMGRRRSIPLSKKNNTNFVIKINTDEKEIFFCVELFESKKFVVVF